MTEAELFDMTRQTLWVAAVVSAPLLLVALVTGVVIGLFQALTSVQEMTLTFVPKIGAMILTFWITMGFMNGTLLAFFQDEIVPRIAGG
ncbi:flagellar biosynthetic protein FliQ [Aliigemmobacter aestuarii]|uniref:Flagellar biosynthetic protein FliQ n=1 Tax=Aliigemmobacter aestuarii TaxID=1445661 RepID=A0A4S3MSJ1_9RHOB|nr:flagellar biosynthetic protein FliQ [Gemmobacter aestuarii]THD85539.1 flagellar biosynthetic protein FliQ [Gemmobacter aestuarii]